MVRWKGIPPNVAEMMSLYSGGHTWCLRCDVSSIGTRAEKCWLCEKSDELYSWRWPNGYPELMKLEGVS